MGLTGGCAPRLFFSMRRPLKLRARSSARLHALLRSLAKLKARGES